MFAKISVGILILLAFGILFHALFFGSQEEPQPVEPENPPAIEQPIAPSTAPPAEGDVVMCTMDVQECPDGTFVGRVAPDCEFEACPGN